MAEIAFRKFGGTLRDTLITGRTLSLVPHCELVIAKNSLYTFNLVASPKVGGVAIVQRPLILPKWEILQWEDPTGSISERLQKACVSEVGKPYNYLGSALMGHACVSEDHHSWFCSELVAHILGLPDPHHYSPGKLYRLAKTRNFLT